MSGLVVHTDGGSRGNPGPAATGVVFLFDSEVIGEHGWYLGEKTNNEAEYQAVIDSLRELPTYLAQTSARSIEWRLDSKLVVEQISRNWKIKEPRLAEYARLVWGELALLSVPYVFRYVPRAENHLADAVVNKTLDAQKTC